MSVWLRGDQRTDQLLLGSIVIQVERFYRVKIQEHLLDGFLPGLAWSMGLADITAFPYGGHLILESWPEPFLCRQSKLLIQPVVILMKNLKHGMSHLHGNDDYMTIK